MLKGAYKSGRKALHDKTGIWALSKEQQKKNARKGGHTLKALMSIPEYRKLHAMKIRYAKAKKRFNKAVWHDA